MSVKILVDPQNVDKVNERLGLIVKNELSELRDIKVIDNEGMAGLLFDYKNNTGIEFLFRKTKPVSQPEQRKEGGLI